MEYAPGIVLSCFVSVVIPVGDNFPDAHRYTSKEIRRGATQESLQTGGTVEVIKSAGAWLGNGFRSYVDFGFNRSRQISRMLIALDDSSPDDENRTPQPKAVRRKRPAEQPSASTDPPESDSPIRNFTNDSEYLLVFTQWVL